ncbi:MAG TPA: GtrA family protein [Candidatus Saccharimonadales bacterium]|nr:GtrA family protein [Candidatus Saccharimonadales bacterium]
MIASLKALPWQRLTKFAVTGGTALAIDTAIYLALTRVGHLPYLGARAVSLALAMIWNFFVNRHWTFQATTGNLTHQAGRFILVMTLTSLASLALMRLGVGVLHLNDLLVLLVVAALITLINFLAHSRWSYAI